MLPKHPFLFLFCFYSAETEKELHFNAIRNVNFNNEKLLENHIASKNAASKILCTQYCDAEPTCLSFNYNTGSGTCVLFDSDFIDVAKTATQTEDGWVYYFLIRDFDRSLRYRCTSTIPTTGICSLFCFHYFYDISHVYTIHASKCAVLDGGEMVRIDRGLKQHCVENLLGNALAVPMVPIVFIQGKKNFITGEWEFDDGTPKTSIPWDTNQPNNPSAEYLALKTTSFRWHDVPSTYSRPEGHAVVCEQN